jgi:hypothetical protein
MAITPAVVRAPAGETRRLIASCKDAPRGIDGDLPVPAMRRGCVRPGWRSALLAVSRRRGKGAGFARGAHGRNQPPAAAAVGKANSIGRIGTAPA